MQVIIAKPPQDRPALSSLTGIDSFVIGNIQYKGWKMEFFKKSETEKDTENPDKPAIVKDESKSPVYDEITQLFIDRNNLQKILEQSTAQNAKSSIDVNELKKQNAMLTQQIAKMQVQNKKG